MSHDKAIKHKKEKRKKYRKSQAFDHTCRNHGACGYCRLNRKHNSKKRKQIADEKLKEGE